MPPLRGSWIRSREARCIRWTGVHHVSLRRVRAFMDRRRRQRTSERDSRASPCSAQGSPRRLRLIAAPQSRLCPSPWLTRSRARRDRYSPFISLSPSRIFCPLRCRRRWPVFDDDFLKARLTDAVCRSRAVHPPERGERPAMELVMERRAHHASGAAGVSFRGCCRSAPHSWSSSDSRQRSSRSAALRLRPGSKRPIASVMKLPDAGSRWA